AGKSILSQLGADWRADVSVKELFPGSFNDIKLFLVSCYYNHTMYVIDHGPTPSYKLYALNGLTGKETKVYDIESFNRVFGDSRNVCNLAKCYLYLLLVAGVEKGLTKAYEHRKQIKKNSIFLTEASGLIN